MDSLEITTEAAVKAHDEASTKGKALLENLFGKKVFVKDIRDLLQSFKDVLEWHGLTQQKFDESNEGLPQDEIGYREVKLIVAAYNLGKKPDYNNSNQVKYSPRFKHSSSGVGFSYGVCVRGNADSVVGSRLDFLNYDNMKDAVSKFLPQYEKFHTK